MTKREFLEQLSKELEGNISSNMVQENMDYYNRYITDEMRSGKSEEEVLQMLGDPWVIAQTIIGTASGIGGEGVYEEERTIYSSENTRQHEKTSGVEWWKKLLFVLFIIMIVMGVIAIATGVIRLLAPLFVPVLIVMLVVRLVNSRHS